MRTCTIEYSRNDKAQYEWRPWAVGYPESLVNAEVMKLRQRNKDFEFVVKPEGTTDDD